MHKRLAVVDEKPLARSLRRNSSRKGLLCQDINRHQVSGREPEPALSCRIELGLRTKLPHQRPLIIHYFSLLTMATEPHELA